MRGVPMGLHEHLKAALDEAGIAGPWEHGHRQGHGPGRAGWSEGERGERRGRRGGHGGPGGRGPGGPGGHGGHRGAGGHGPWQGAGPEQVDSADVVGWLTGRLPDGWLTGPPAVTVDRDEILIVGPLAAPEMPDGAVEG